MYKFYIFFGILGVVLMIVGLIFDKDICEDDENDKVNRHYSGDKE